MNYFTPEWHSGYVDEHPGKKYREHLVPLLRQWPSYVRLLANSINLHDGQLRKFAWNIDEATLFLRLRCGDLQVGYFDLDLHYSGVLFSQADWASLLTLSASKSSSALYDEVDEDNGRFVHRILFISYRRTRRSRRFRLQRGIKLWNRIKSRRRFRPKSRYREAAIQFEKSSLTVTPREGRFDAGMAL